MKTHTLDGGISKVILNAKSDSPFRAHHVAELRAAQVHAIFKLPEELGEFSTPLAYIQWFRKFTSKDQTVNMYKISPSTQGGGYGNTSIVPITHIARSCHLIPTFGETMDRSAEKLTYSFPQPIPPPP